jgi:hypothetical protein
MVKLLLDNGAQQSINIPDRYGNTIISTAVSKNNIEMIQLLLEYGASLDSKIMTHPTIQEFIFYRDFLYKKYFFMKNLKLLEYGAIIDSKTMTHPLIQEFISYRDFLYKKFFFTKNLQSITQTKNKKKLGTLQLPNQNTVKPKPNLYDFWSRQSYEDALRQYKKSLQKYVIPRFMTIKAFPDYFKEIELNEKIPEYIIRTVDRELEQDLVIKDCLKQIFSSKKKRIEDMIHEKEKDHRTFLYYLRSIGADPYTNINGIDRLIELCL